MESRRTVFLYDGFSSRHFGGNVAGVMLEASGLGADLLQRIAAELNAPTTGFVVGAYPDPQPTYDVRFFTPTQEIDLCGHVTVALLTAIVETERLKTMEGGTEVHLRTPAGEIVVRAFDDGGSVKVAMGLRLPAFDEREVDESSVAGALDAEHTHASMPIRIVSAGLRHIFVPFDSPEQVLALRPDFGAIADLSHRHGVDTVAAFALVDQDPRRVVMRDFCAGIGTNEEAASGTTSGALACYLLRYGPLTPESGGVATVRVEMGESLGRPAEIEARLETADGKIVGVSVLGRARRILVAELDPSVFQHVTPD